MDFNLISNPLLLIFKLSHSGNLSEEIEDPSKFPLLYDFIFENFNKKNSIQALNVIKILIELIKRKRSISAYFPKYNNKSIYVFLFKLFLQKSNISEYRIALKELILELCANIQLSKDVFDFIFQEFSKLYREDNITLDNNINYSINEYFSNLLELLNIIFSPINKEKISPNNYFSCFGNNTFDMTFYKNILRFENYFSFNLNFKISNSKIMEKNPEILNKSRLLSIHFVVLEKIINIDLKYPNDLFIFDGSEEIKVKTLPLGDWMNLLITFFIYNGNITVYFNVNGEKMNEPIKMKMKLNRVEEINSISFFENFFGEVSSIIIISQKDKDSFDIFSKNFNFFSEMKKGLWDNKHYAHFIKYAKNIIYNDKKKDKNGKVETLYDDLIAIFTPINLNPIQPEILKDIIGNYYIEIIGNIKNQKYYLYQKNINQICSINNFLPIAEMFIIHKKDFLNQKNFVDYLQLISKIVCGKDNAIEMNKCKFFKLLGMILEKLPKKYFDENILKEFENIGNNILEINIKYFDSDFFTEILLNETIIFKFNDKLRISFWNIFLQFYLTKNQSMISYLDTQKLCSILLLYDELAHSKMCCQFHLNMIKKELIGKASFMEPNLNYQLFSLKKLINKHLFNQKMKNIHLLIELLIYDISPCLAKIILEILINFFTSTNIDEELIKNLTFEIFNSKYIIIFVNLFIHSLPDIKYEILNLMLFLFISLVNQKKIYKFHTFLNMIKTCLLPNNISNHGNSKNKIIPSITTDSKKINKDIDKNLNFEKDNIIQNKKDDLKKDEKKNQKDSNSKDNKKQIDKENEKKYNEKNKENNKVIDENVNNEKRRSSVALLVNIFENKNNIDKSINENQNSKIIPAKLIDEKAKIFESKTSKIKEQTQKQNPTKIQKIENKNDSTENNIKDNLVRKSLDNVNINKKNEEIKSLNKKEVFSNKESEKRPDKKSKKNYIFKEEIYKLYIYNIYNFFLQWSLGIYNSYDPDLSKELFSSFKNQKETKKLKNTLIVNINILELAFFLNKIYEDDDFNFQFISDLEILINSPQNSFLILLNDKLFSLLLDIIFKYYTKQENIPKKIELYKKSSKLCVDIFINSLHYLENQNMELPMKRLEIFLLWGIINLNHLRNEELIFDFLHELINELNIQFKNSFKEKLKTVFEFDFEESQIRKNFYFRNYLLLLTFIYNFSIHYKLDKVLKIVDENEIFNKDSYINIPEIFISGLRTNPSKAKNLNEYWKDFCLIENFLNDIDYIFMYGYLKNKIFKPKFLVKKKEEKTKEINYDKYKNIINEMLFNKSKRNLFYNELYFLCFTESKDKNKPLIIPLVKIISISYMCILSSIKNIENKTQFIYWLDKYKNLLRFLILASININRNKNQFESYNIIQNICFEVISSGLCFLYNLLITCNLYQNEIIIVINNIFLLFFSILKIFLNKKISLIKADINTLPNAITILFNDYLKEQNKMTIINITTLENTYLNPAYEISDLIRNKDFVEIFFKNQNLKRKLWENYYSLSAYKNSIEERDKLLINLDYKMDYSYQMEIFNIISEFENASFKLNNKRFKKYVKNRKEYKKQKRKLFTYNGMWSNRNLFYGKINSQIIKYKVMNHYSKDLMRPLLAPIFDINYYLPEFTNFDKKKLFMEDNSKENNISYDLMLDFENILIICIYNKKKDNNLLNKVPKNILREIFYKSNKKYYDALEKISKLLKSELIGKKEYLILKDKNKEENLLKKDNNLKEKTEELTTKETSEKIKKELEKHKGSLDENIINISLEKEKVILNNKNNCSNSEYINCCLVKPTHHIKGLFYFKNNKIIFKNLLEGKVKNDSKDKDKEIDDMYDEERDVCFGSYFKKYEKDKNLFKLSINLSDIKMLLKRKYYYKNSSIEIFTFNNKSYFFNFESEKIRKILLKIIINKIGYFSIIINDMKESNNKNNKDNEIGFINNMNFSGINKLESKKNIFKLSKIIKIWKNWEISNFEFLMTLNILSNRSYLDISQYPVFPWILENYEDPLIKDSLDTKDTKDYYYRNLSLPMGMMELNEDGKNRALNYLSTFKILKGDKNINKPYFYVQLFNKIIPFYSDLYRNSRKWI